MSCGEPGGYFDGPGAFLTSAASRGRKIEGDDDGDGHISLAERFDADGDGKVSMAEYAKQTNLPTDGSHPEQFAADNVGVSKAERTGWALIREARRTGAYNPTIADRVREGTDSMNYVASKGGWQPSRRKWAGPDSPGGENLNVRGYKSAAPASANPFEVRSTIADVAIAARQKQLQDYLSKQFEGRKSS